MNEQEVQHNADYVALAEAAAEAQQANFYIGVRPNGKGWFAHCDDVEFDGSDPDMAVRSVIQELQRRSHLDSHEWERKNVTIERRRVGLAAIDASTPDQIDGEERP